MKKYSFIIDTNSYSGNFEREMCAFLTGQVGECGVGDEHAKEFKEQFPNEYAIFEDIIGSESDDNGCYRPCDITETPGRFTKHPAYESVLIHFCKKPPTEIIEFMERRALEFAETQTIDYNNNHCKILGFRLEEHVTTTTSIPI